MREIKFRIWDSSFKKILLANDIKFVDGLMIGAKGVNWDSKVVVMQFTGLKDKNGVEIYEGDIIKFSGHYSGDSWIKEHTEVIEWDINGYTESLMVGYADEPDWCEVIGNIYENPELLTKGKN